MENLLTPDLINAVKGINLSDPATFKTAAVAIAVIVISKASWYIAKAIIKGLKLLAAKTKTPQDDEILDGADKQLDKQKP